MSVSSLRVSRPRPEVERVEVKTNPGWQCMLKCGLMFGVILAGLEEAARAQRLLLLNAIVTVNKARVRRDVTMRVTVWNQKGMSPRVAMCRWENPESMWRCAGCKHKTSNQKMTPKQSIWSIVAVDKATLTGDGRE